MPEQENIELNVDNNKPKGRLILRTPLADKLDLADKPIVVLEGGSGSSKTWTVAQYLIRECLSPQKEAMSILVLRSLRVWTKLSVFRDFKDILSSQFGLWDDRYFNKSELTYILNGHTFFFQGCDHGEAQKFHGPRFHYVWINEGNEITYETYTQVASRLRRRLFVDFNPKMGEDHWIVEKLLKRDEKGQLENNEVYYIHSTYKDNPFLPAVSRRQIEGYEPKPENIKKGTADATKWKVYGLGQRAVIEGLIFPEIKIVKEMPRDLDNVCYGMDFGYNPDPSVLVKKGEKDGILYLREILYERKLGGIINPHNPSRPTIEGRFKTLKIRKELSIWADSAEPMLIDDLFQAGYNIKRVNKPKGSILSGIEIMKRFRIYVVEDSINLIKEFRNYTWAKSKDGGVTSEPIDKYNHCFVKGTMITTRRGLVPIESLRDDDMVLTRKGFRRIIWHGPTRVSDKLIEIKFSNGKKLIGVDDHKIYTNHGLIKMRSIRKGYKVIDEEYICQRLSAKRLLKTFLFKWLFGMDRITKAWRTTFCKDNWGVKVISIKRLKTKRTVYNLEVEHNHEYIANGILVANCIDAARYACYMTCGQVKGKYWMYPIEPCHYGNDRYGGGVMDEDDEDEREEKRKVFVVSINNAN